MMSNNDIVEEVVISGIIGNALNIYAVQMSHRDDLTQEVCVILLAMDNARLNDIRNEGKLSHFVTKIVKNQWCSSTSTYYSYFRKYEKKKATSDYRGITLADDE